MNMTVMPGPLSGRVDRVISSKSQVHRLLICAALSDRPVTVGRVTLSEDIEATCRCLRALGAEVRAEEDRLEVAPPDRFRDGALLDCGESGSTLRFLLPAAAALGVSCAFTGRGRLAGRPLSPLDRELTAHGVRLSGVGCFPLRLSGQLQSGEYTLPGHVTSQYFTGLLTALPRLPGDSLLRIEGTLESRPYVNLTLEVLSRFGILVSEGPEGFRIPGGQRFRGPERTDAEGDWSGAAFWLAAGALSPQGVSCAGLNPDSAQGDRAALALLRDFGAEVSVRDGLVTVRRGDLRGLDIDASDIPDLVPVLAVVAACAKGETRFRSVGRLRLKESDRVASVLALLHALGVRAEANGDTLTVTGRGRLSGGTADSFRDHRIAMSAAVAAGAADEPVTILGAESVAKSYPGFFDQLALLGGIRKEETA